MKLFKPRLCVYGWTVPARLIAAHLSCEMYTSPWDGITTGRRQDGGRREGGGPSWPLLIEAVVSQHPSRTYSRCYFVFFPSRCYCYCCCCCYWCCRGLNIQLIVSYALLAVRVLGSALGARDRCQVRKLFKFPAIGWAWNLISPSSKIQLI